jgi:hypothetical protein
MSKILVDTIDTRSGTSTLTLGASNAGTIALGSGDVQSNFLQPSFFVKLSSSQSISSGSFTKITFDSEEWDTDSAFASNKFTVPSGKAGKYFFTAGIYIDGLDDGEYNELFFYKNGGSVNWGRQNSNSPRTDAHGAFTTNAILNLNASDYIEIYVYQNEGAARNADANYTFFAGHRIGT